jgi:predicted ATPase/class 3 adenylate cyclase
MNTSLPAGTVTFFFSDIEGSTRLWEKHPDGMRPVVERHDRYLTQAIHECSGSIVKTTGDGFHAVFERAENAVEAACLAQKQLAADKWGEINPDALRTRIGVYTGEAAVRSGDYYGDAVNRAARLMDAGHGGQILLSASTFQLMQDRWPEGTQPVDLGQHRLKDLVRPEHIYQLSHPYLPQSFPPIYTVDEYPNNLPVQLTSYIGRVRAMAEARRLLESTRLLTIIGPGGTGKTRLALQLAADLLVSSEQHFPHGVWLAELGPIRDAEMVVETVASVFQVRQQSSSQPLIELLTQYLRHRQLLLILDNCEHLIEACAHLADHLLRYCPQVKIIASSREALGIAGESIYSLPSLSLPLPSSKQPDEMLQSEAVQLFVERAAAAQPRFRLTGQNAPAVTRICRRLDGIPLALELAAARLKVFTPEQIAARLDDRFRLLTGGSRTALPRQQTLGALIDWSYDLLSDEEQALFRKLSVFVGGLSYEAAEFICEDLDVLNLLTNLVNKSLVIFNEQGGEGRYYFLETMRQYALDKLMSMGESNSARNRHLEYFLNFTADNEEQIFFADSLDSSIQTMDRLDLEFDNIRAAIEWGIDNRPVEALLLVGGFHFYIGVRGSPLEGERLIRAAIAAVEQLPPPQGTEEQERRMQALARGWIGAGQLTIVMGESLRANTDFEKGLPLARQLEDKLTLGIGLFFKTTTAFFMNDIAGAREAVHEIEALVNDLKDPRWNDLVLATSSWLRMDERTGSTAVLEEAYQKVSRLNSPLAIELQLLIGFNARLQKLFDAAHMYLEDARRFFPVYRSRSFEAMTLSELAHLKRETGRIAEARAMYRQTILLWKDMGHRAAIANQLECLAYLNRAEGDAEGAVLLLGAAEAVREEVEAIMTDYERPEYEMEVKTLREQMGEQEFTRLWAEGRRMTMEEAVARGIG